MPSDDATRLPTVAAARPSLGRVRFQEEGEAQEDLRSDCHQEEEEEEK